MAGRFAGRIVLISGASAGIGRASALAFAREGARVLALARSAERLESLAAEAGGSDRLVPVVADVADGASMEAAASRILSSHGAPDVIVANAGVGLDALLRETSDELLRRLLEVNLFGVVRTIRPFLHGMTRRGSGRILLISSVIGKRGIPHYAAYCASKFALHGIADALRPELLGTGVTVGIVCPSTTVSEFADRMTRTAVRQPHVRLATHSAESVAAAIVRMARSRRRERILSIEGRAMLWLDAMAPGLLDRALARVLVRRGG